MADAVREAIAESGPKMGDKVGALRGKLTSVKDHVATVHNFGKQVPMSEKAVDSFYDLAVNATNRLQKSIGLPSGPITAAPTPPPTPPPPPPAPAGPAAPPAPALAAPAPALAAQPPPAVFE